MEVERTGERAHLLAHPRSGGVALALVTRRVSGVMLRVLLSGQEDGMFLVCDSLERGVQREPVPADLEACVPSVILVDRRIGGPSPLWRVHLRGIIETYQALARMRGRDDEGPSIGPRVPVPDGAGRPPRRRSGAGRPRTRPEHRVQDLYDDAKSDLETLVGTLVGFACEQLESDGAFWPIGATLDEGGEASLLGTDADEGVDDPAEVLAVLHAALRLNRRNGSRAAAACEWVTIRLPEQEPTDAIKIHVEHDNGLVVAFYLPMERDAEGGWTAGDMLSTPAELEIGLDDDDDDDGEDDVIRPD